MTSPPLTPEERLAELEQADHDRATGKAVAAVSAPGHSASYHMPSPDEVRAARLRAQAGSGRPRRPIRPFFGSNR